MALLGPNWHANRGLLLAALLSAATFAGAPARAQTTIRFSLDGRIDGPAALFLAPLDKGLFEAEGLAVTVDAAATALEPITRIAGGEYDMALADINLLIRYRDENSEAVIKAVFMVYNRPPYAIVARKSRGVEAPKDLTGKRLAVPADEPTTAQWPLFASLTGIDRAAVEIETVSAAVRAPMLAAGEVDAIACSAFVCAIDLKARGVPADDIVTMVMAEYGVAAYGAAIIVNPTFAEAHPEAVKGFLRAFLKGLRSTVRRPADAIRSILRRDELADRRIELERLRMVLRDNVVTPEVKQNGYGTINADRFAKAVDQLASTTPFKTRPTLDDIFDPSFLPPAANVR